MELEEVISVQSPSSSSGKGGDGRGEKNCQASRERRGRRKDGIVNQTGIGVWGLIHMDGIVRLDGGD